MLLRDFDYDLPSELIAQTPLEPRDHSRLMVIDGHTGEITHDHFYNLKRYISPNEQLVFNNSKVFPARLLGHKLSGGKVEILLIKKMSETVWEVMIRNVATAQKLFFSEGLEAQVLEQKDDGTYTVTFNKQGEEFWRIVEQIGQVPLPPYIKEETILEIPSTKSQTNQKSKIQHSREYLRSRYQTVYAKEMGSAAAPTAGLHFTPELLHQFEQTAYVTLHVGLGTFQPLQSERVEDNHLHSEFYSLKPEDIDVDHVVAVGTTTVRVLESWAQTGNTEGETTIFIYPGYTFRAVKKLITNFHLPQSSLLMLVCAFGGTELILRAYREAVRERYRFFSFGDAMIVI